jgi:hypothetical protein
MINNLVNKLLSFRNTIKIYHWNTIYYKDHIISNDLLINIDDNIDKLTEILLGLKDEKIHIDKKYDIKHIDSTNDFINEIKRNCDFLEVIDIKEIKNIIDDIINISLKSIYLLKKK